VKRHVALIGFMGAGKSTIGRCLARELELPFFDSDEFVVARHGPIAKIFEQSGAATFRKYEYDAVRELLEGTPGVVALGGGAVTHEPTRELLAQAALRVYLEVPVSALLARLRRSRTTRPVIGESPTLETVRALLESREPLYREAEIVVNAARRSRNALAREIAAAVRASREASLA
jgi:shikimate kinase